MEIRETVQRNVARYIKGSDYTQAEIARMLGVSRNPTRTDEIPQFYFNIVWGILSI